MKRISIAILSVLLVAALAARQRPIQFGTDNDVIVQSDGGYTGGLFLGFSFNSGKISKETVLDSKLSSEKNTGAWSVQVRQKIWTPADISLKTPLGNDRRYAGQLTLALATHLFSESSSWLLGLQAGVIGPSSGADSVQRETHKWFGSTELKAGVIR